MIEPGVATAAGNFIANDFHDCSDSALMPVHSFGSLAAQPDSHSLPDHYHCPYSSFLNEPGLHFGCSSAFPGPSQSRIQDQLT